MSMIFLYNFTIVPNGIDFVLNTQLAEDMGKYGINYEIELKALSDVLGGIY